MTQINSIYVKGDPTGCLTVENEKCKKKKNSLTPTLKSRRKNSSCGLALKKHLSPYFIFSKINKSSYPRSPVNVGKHSCSKQPDPIA